MYEYKAIVVSIYDGDTVTLDIDLGLGVWQHNVKVRLYGIDTPEMRGEYKACGKLARDKVIELLSKEVTVFTRLDKKGVYGRLLGVLVNNEGLYINDHLLRKGYAVACLNKRPNTEWFKRYLDFGILP